MGQYMHDRLFHVAIVCFGEPPQQDGKRARPIVDEGSHNVTSVTDPGDCDGCDIVTV